MAKQGRVCAACGKDCRGKRVWERGMGQRVICYSCGATHTFKIDRKTVVERQGR